MIIKLKKNNPEIYYTSNKLFFIINIYLFLINRIINTNNIYIYCCNKNKCILFLTLFKLNKV